MGPPHAVLAAYDDFRVRLDEMGLHVQPTKCTAWCPQGLPNDLSIPAEFCKPSMGIRALGVPMGTSTFVDSFVADALVDDSSHLDLLPRLGDPQIAVRLLTLCYARAFAIKL